jgi:hypothetical protein
MGTQPTCVGWPQIAILLTSASQVARIIGVSHWRLAKFFFCKLYLFSHLLDFKFLSAYIKCVDNENSACFFPPHADK